MFGEAVLRLLACSPCGATAMGADFHRAMVATATGEKHLIGRRPVRNWTRRTMSSLFVCRKLHLVVGKSTKTAAIRTALFDTNIHQIVSAGASTQTPLGELGPTDLLAVFRGPTSKRREKRGGEGRGKDRKGGDERGGEGGSPSFALGRKRSVHMPSAR